MRTGTDKTTHLELYPCDELCFPRQREDIHRRRVFKCTRFGMSPDEWLPDSADPYPYSAHMGIPTDQSSGDAELRKKHPREPHCDGCPGGWYETPFVYSLLDYEPLRSEGNFQQCLELEEADSPLIRRWVRLLQIERLRQSAHEMKQWSSANKS